MIEGRSRWMSKLGARSVTATAAAAGALLWCVGCGPYEQQPEFPQSYQEVAPPPPTAAELAAQQQAREQAAAQSEDIVIGADPDEYADADPSALTEFRPALEGHGTWVDDSTYGTVWVPSSAEVGVDFQPYVTAGHWTYSEETDYVWVSDYAWGWAPFHYGRWVYLPGHGWAWIPGRRYAGAWVTWRVGPAGYGYVGWAPMGPSWYWYDGYPIGWSFVYYRPYDYYVYCPRTYVYHETVATHVVRGPAAREHYGRTQDYVPASPHVDGGGRVLASPTVNGVSGTDRVIAHPAVSGSGAGARTANAVRGPRPDEMGLRGDMVVAPPAAHPGLERAQTYATPRTAALVGAAAPAHLSPDLSAGGRSGAAMASGAAPSSSSFVGSGTPGSIAGRAPAHAAMIPQSESGVASVRPHERSMPDVSPTPTYRSPPASVASPSAPIRSTQGIGHSVGSTAPAYRSAPTVSSPMPRSLPARSTPVVSAPTFHAAPSTPTFRSPTPSVHAPSSSPIHSAPSTSVKSSSPSTSRSVVRGRR